MLLVSHDRYLVQRIAHKIMQLEEGQLKYYDGGYDYYLSKSRKKKNSDRQVSMIWISLIISDA